MNETPNNSGHEPQVLAWGIDPGITGAIARVFFTDEGKPFVRVWDMPTVLVGKKKVISPYLCAEILDMKEWSPFQLIRGSSVLIERVGAMPGQGVTSMFRFGEAYGIIKGVLGGLRLPVELVSPAVWKRAMKVQKGKESSRLRALELFPEQTELFKLKKDHGRADAALIALYNCIEKTPYEEI